MSNAFLRLNPIKIGNFPASSSITQAQENHIIEVAACHIDGYRYVRQVGSRSRVGGEGWLAEGVGCHLAILLVALLRLLDEILLSQPTD